MKGLFRLGLLLVVVVPLVDSLAVAVGAETGNFAGSVDIGGGRKMYLKCSGRGSPTVVLVGGLRASADDWSISNKSTAAVFTEVGKFTRVCACDRPGTPVGEKPSRSDPLSQPTTAKNAVDDLHALLMAADKAGPYVLVGHSYGGVIVRLYASTYSNDMSDRARKLFCWNRCVHDQHNGAVECGDMSPL
jgi:pimeloyl-ACP methyl ester carboxylesterase